jgi:integrase/recombinase XerD
MELSELYDRYDIEIGIMPLSERTAYSYRLVLRKFISENDRVYRMSELELKQYFSNFRKKYSDSYYNVICSCAKILYEKVLKQPNKMLWFKPIQTDKKFKDIITHEQFVSMMKATNNIKHKTFIILLFSTGIRIGELLTIKISDIDFKRKRIFIYSEKNGKNGYVQLHEITEKYILSYLKLFKPKKYLLEGTPGEMYSATSVRNVLKKTSKDLNKNIYPHLFRTSYITKVIEKENVFKAQEMARHKSLKSTLHYYHISQEQLMSMYNPLDD